MDFSEKAIESVRDFVSSAVIIDDQFHWEGESSNSNGKALIVPFKKDEFSGQVELHESDGDAKPGRGAPLDVKALIRSFSEEGIICSPYHWGEDDSVLPLSTRKSDLLILDWKLQEVGDGEIAKKIVYDRVEKDILGENRLRLITIYTSEKEEDVLGSLEKEFENLSSVNVTRDSGFLNISNSRKQLVTRIIWLQKNAIVEGDLAKEILSNFAAFVQGFSPSVLLAAISEIRKKTYHYLAQFNRGLDEPLISHYTALKSQENTFKTAETQLRDYVANLIGVTVQSSLSHSQEIKDLTSRSAIKAYFKQNVNSFDLLDSKGTVCAKSEKKSMIIFSPSYEELSERYKSVFGRRYTRETAPLFLGSDLDQRRLELSALDLLKRQSPVFNTPPVMKLGTILKSIDFKSKKEEFYLCIQPLCDGVRLCHKSYHRFPFLKLTPATLKKFNIVLLLEDEYSTFVCDPNAANIKVFEFKSLIKTQDIRGRRTKNGKHYFKDKKNKTYYWLAELREVYCQDILNKLAHQGSRVGSDKFEWLRIRDN